MKNIIVIAHKFYPFNGVGANRWNHLSKHLAECGFKVHILTVERGTVPFLHENIKVHKVKAGWFYKLASLKFKNHLFTAIYQNILNYIKKIFWFDDEAQYWGKHLIKAIDRAVIAHNVKVVIATGHPFQANRWAAEAKKKSSCKFKLIQDIRDPWALNPFKTYIFKWQKEKVATWQNQALSLSDANVYVTEELKLLTAINDSKSFVIENGHSFFTDYIKRNSQDGKNIIHAGTLANGRDVIAEPFFIACKANPEILRGHTVHFYGRVSMWLIRKYSELFVKKVFILHKPVPQDKLIHKYAMSAFALQFNAKEYPYLVSTKIYEHPAMGLSTFSINCGGAIDALIKSHDIGISCKPDVMDIISKLPLMFEADNKVALKKYADMSSYKVRAAEYTKLINKLSLDE